MAVSLICHRIEDYYDRGYNVATAGSHLASLEPHRLAALRVDIVVQRALRVGEQQIQLEVV